MKKIAVITTTRSEYSLLSPLIKKIREKENKDFIAELIVTGTHLSKDYGMTIHEIDDRIDHKIPISVRSETEVDISENQADTLVKFTKLFIKEKYDAIVILGDRYETLAIAIAAGNTKTPIFHLCGGDTTEGAIDEWIRHSITKISYLHFVSNEESMKRVIQLGEDPIRVYNYGSTGIDNIINIADMSKEEALMSIGLHDCKYALCTYHPVTMDNESVDEQINELLNSISAFPTIEFIMTKSNADLGGARINGLLDKYEGSIKNLHVYTSLGAKKYLSLMRHAEFVIGNSSSGIIETPVFHIPTINIGNRQRGRLQSESIINCKVESNEIIAAINKATSSYYKKICKKAGSYYGDGHATEKIARKMIETVMNEEIDLKKHFFNI